MTCPDGPLGIEELARRLGRCRWVELRLFEVLGGWVTSVPEPEVKHLLAVHGPHHAWHAELWHDRRPRLAHLPADELVAPATPEVAELLDAVAAAEGTVERLVGAYRVVLPALVAAYSAHLDRCREPTDGPIARSLRFALADEVEHWRQGEVLLQRLLRTANDVARAADHQSRLQQLLAVAGGIAGPGTVPAP